MRAARLLHMTQPALSRQISALEHDLGAQLFDRDRRGTSLTQAGQQLLEDAVPLLAASSALERRTRQAAREQGRFAVGFMPGIHATPIIREFARRAPHLRIDVVFTSVTEQVDFLIDGRVDVCFVRLPLAEHAFTVLPLFPEPRVAAVPSSHPAAGSGPIEVKQLFDLPLLQTRPRYPSGAAWWPTPGPPWPRPGPGGRPSRRAWSGSRWGPGSSSCPRASRTSTVATTSATCRCSTSRPGWWLSPTISTAPCPSSASSPTW